MKSAAEIIEAAPISPYRGSEKTYRMVKDQIAGRWGDECAKAFDPHKDAMPFASWLKFGYRVRKGEKALRSVTIIEMTDGEGRVQQRIPRTVFLFHRRQVDPIGHGA